MFATTKEFFKRAKVQILNIFDKSKNFIKSSREKFQNLYQTNYNTGMYHLEHGNLWDATFRFKIIKRFWPNELEAQYKYAYCLVLQEMNGDAETLLKEILEKDPNYEEARNLLQKIENNDTKKMVDDFKAKFNKQTTTDEEVKRDETNK